MNMCGKVRHAIDAVEAGCDIVVAQGTEAGGHTGRIATNTLVPLIVDAVGDRVPVVAAGGIFDGRGLASALTLGADGIWVGTRFIATPEAHTVDGYKERLVSMAEDDTVVSKAYTGKTCRVVRNSYTDAFDAAGGQAEPFPMQYIKSVRDGANHLGAEGRPEGFDPDKEFWPAGQGAGGIQDLVPAAELVERFVAEAEAGPGPGPRRRHRLSPSRATRTPPPVPAPVLTTLLDRHDPASGDWVTVRADEDRVRRPLRQSPGTASTRPGACAAAPGRSDASTVTSSCSPPGRSRSWSPTASASTSTSSSTTWPGRAATPDRTWSRRRRAPRGAGAGGRPGPRPDARAVVRRPPAAAGAHRARRPARPRARSPSTGCCGHPTPEAHAQRAFGRVTRPLVRAFAASLLPAARRPDPFEPALLAMMASPWCGPEQLTEILSTPRTGNPGRWRSTSARWTGPARCSRGRPGPQAAARLRAALAEPDGTRLLGPGPAGMATAPAPGRRRSPAAATPHLGPPATPRRRRRRAPTSRWPPGDAAGRRGARGRPATASSCPAPPTS